LPVSIDRFDAPADRFAVLIRVVQQFFGLPAEGSGHAATENQGSCLLLLRRDCSDASASSATTTAPDNAMVSVLRIAIS
jgi:hypothetical protein